MAWWFHGNNILTTMFRNFDSFFIFSSTLKHDLGGIKKKRTTYSHVSGKNIPKDQKNGTQLAELNSNHSILKILKIDVT